MSREKLSWHELHKLHELMNYMSYRGCSCPWYMTFFFFFFFKSSNYMNYMNYKNYKGMILPLINDLFLKVQKFSNYMNYMNYKGVLLPLIQHLRDHMNCMTEFFFEKKSQITQDTQITWKLGGPLALNCRLYDFKLHITQIIWITRGCSSPQS